MNVFSNIIWWNLCSIYLFFIDSVTETSSNGTKQHAVPQQQRYTAKWEFSIIDLIHFILPACHKKAASMKTPLWRLSLWQASKRLNVLHRCNQRKPNSLDSSVSWRQFATTTMMMTLQSLHCVSKLRSRSVLWWACNHRRMTVSYCSMYYRLYLLRQRRRATTTTTMMTTINEIDFWIAIRSTCLFVLTQYRSPSSHLRQDKSITRFIIKKKTKHSSRFVVLEFFLLSVCARTEIHVMIDISASSARCSISAIVTSTVTSRPRFHSSTQIAIMRRATTKWNGNVKMWNKLRNYESKFFKKYTCKSYDCNHHSSLWVMSISDTPWCQVVLWHQSR